MSCMKRERVMENNNIYSYSIIEFNGKKYFKKELLRVDKEHIDLLNNELHKWNLLKKYNFIPNICFFDNEKQHYAIYEYIEGLTLDNYKFNSLQEKIEILISIIEKLYTMHSLFLVHGDLKPTNIIITSDKKIYIIDLAITKYIGEINNYGTLKYCSLAQINKEKVNVGFDIYALGIILYELLTNKKVYENMSKEQIIISKKDNNFILDDDSIPLEIEKIIFKMLNNGYSNLLEIKSDLMALK